MVNKLPTEKRALALHDMVEGCSMRSIERKHGISLNTIYRLHADAGGAAIAYHKKVAQDLDVSLVQCDEIWSFCYAKKKNVPTAIAAPKEAGDLWTWTALDVGSRFMLTWEVGDRSTKMAHRLMRSLKSRLNGERIQLTTDGHRPYLKAVPKAFGKDIDYATLVKTFHTNGDPTIDARTVIGDPDPDLINTSYVERSNLSMRSDIRRLTRRTNGFSKRVDGHIYSISLYFLYYNFCRRHRGLNGMTPAQVLGLTNEPRSMEWIVGLIDERAPQPNRPKTYNKSPEMRRKRWENQGREIVARLRRVREARQAGR